MSQTYISILRGINVSGQKLIKMDALRQLYEKQGFENVRSYVQSGNVVFTAGEAPENALAQQLSEGISTTFGFDVPVIVLSTESLSTIIDQSPFFSRENIDPAFLHVTFLASRPRYDAIDVSVITSKKQGGEEILFGDKAVYLYCPHGYGKTKLTNNLLESKLRVGATTRNWKTTNELLRMAKHMS